MPNGVGAARRIPTPNDVGRIFHPDDATLRDAMPRTISRDDVAAAWTIALLGMMASASATATTAAAISEISTAPKINAQSQTAIARVRAGRW